MKLQFELFEDERRACVRRARLQRRLYQTAGWLVALCLALVAGLVLAFSVHSLFSP